MEEEDTIEVYLKLHGNNVCNNYSRVNYIGLVYGLEDIFI